MKKLYLLLMAVVFTLAANAGTKNLLKMDFESGTPTSLGWTSPNNAAGMTITGDEYGNYFQFTSGSNSGGRSCYKLWGADIFTDQLAGGTYHIEFEWANTVHSATHYGTEIALFSGTKPGANNAQIASNAATLFSVSEAADNHDLFFINGDATNTFSVDQGWFAVLLDVNVNTRTIEWRIVDQLTRQETKASGTRTFDEGTDMLISGLNINCARGAATIQLDNLKVQIITDYDIANVPSVALTGVNNEERTYSIEFQEEEVLHVKGTDGTETEVLYGDTEGGVYKYTTTTSGTLEAWTTSGTATSEKVSVAVDCNIIQLPQATVAITNAQAGFAKEYTISVSNESVPTKPTLYVSYEYKDENGTIVKSAEEKFSGEKVAVDDKGTLTVTVVAMGFGSSVTSVTNDTEFEVKNVIDFQHMTVDDLTAKGFEDKGTLDAASGGGESTWTSGKRLYYRIATGETDDDGNPTWTNYPVYGASEAGLTPIQRYRFLQSKLTQEVAHTMFAPLYTWYYNDGVVATSCDENGEPLTSDSAQPKGSDNMVHAIGGSVNVQVYVGVGFVFPGVQGDAENYDPAGAGYGNIRVQNATLGVDGLTDDEFIIVSKIQSYGNTANHGDYPAGTDPEAAKADWLQQDMGATKEVYTGLQTFQLYRIDTAISRVTVLTPKGGSTGIETINYNKIVSDQNAPIYNLNGVQVNPNALQKGIYIKQGKKFIVR